MDFNFKQVTIGQMKTFKRLCGRNWYGYPWAELTEAPAEDHAALYYVVQQQVNPGYTEEELESLTAADIDSMYDVLSNALTNPQTGSETSS